MTSPAQRTSPAVEYVHPAAAQLADGTALVRRVAAERPRLTCEALLGGATPAQVAEALGVELIELRAAVGRWTTREMQAGRLTQDGYAALMNIVFGPADRR